MAFTPKTWTARLVQYPGRRKLTPTGATNEYDVARSEGSITAAGDVISAENMNDLETRISDEFLNKLDSSIITSGTWTPTLYGTAAAGAPTYSAQNGSYEAIGKHVHLRFQLVITSKGGMAGNMRIGGLPFSANAQQAENLFSAYPFTGASSAVTSILGHTDVSQNYITLGKPSAGASVELTADDITDSFSIWIGGLNYCRG
jgi:hypothetical protein